MNDRYSPSKINAFDGCKLKYKYQYIDNLESDITTIEGFMGSRVHEALESFYKLVKNGRIESLDWLSDKYEGFWEKNYNDSIKIVRKDLTAEDYFNKGKRCLIDYYDAYKPFNQTKIVETEYYVDFEIKKDDDKYSFRGILDRLDWDDKNKNFEIHDYKTTSKLMTQGEADDDWQLGLYHVALEKKWPDAQRIKLVWHALSFNKEIISYRTKNQLDGLQEAVIKRVKEIESCNNFPPEKSALCDWCDFQNICPLWKHPKEMEDLSVNEYKKDPGVKLVANYKELQEEKNELQEKIEEIEKKQEKIKEAAIDFAEREKISIIDGSDARLKVDIKDEFRAPTKGENPEAWGNLRDFLKNEGKYEEVSTVMSKMVSYRIENNIWPLEFIDKIKKFLIQQVTKTVRLIKK